MIIKIYKVFGFIFIMASLLFVMLSLLPFLYVIFFLVVLKKRAFNVMFGTYILTVLILHFFWKFDYNYLLNGTISGFLSALEIFLIIFSILLLFNLLKISGKLEDLKDFLKRFTNDKNILIILIGWFVVSFFEAIAGFGTPAAIAAPLLVFLGIRPLTAVIITLIADSTAVSFGAFGVPISKGIGSVVNSSSILKEITFNTGLINGIVSIFMPLLLLVVYYLLEKKNLKNLKPYIPISLFSGTVFGFFYTLSSYYLTAEFPSVIASLLGMIIVIFMLINGMFLGKKFKSKNFDKFLLSFLPYMLVITFLIFSRLNIFNIGDILKSIKLEINLIEPFNQFIFSFYTPGILIFLSFFIFSLIYKTKLEEYKEIVNNSFNKSKYALLTLLFTLAFVKLIIYSNNPNYSYLQSMPYNIASIFNNFGLYYLFISPFIGAFGSFIAGSATVSNIIFTSLQQNIALQNNLNPSIILALQNIGGGAGNMIAIHNIIAVSALVNIKNKESKIIKTNLKVLVTYCLLVSLLGYLLILFFY